MCALPPPPRIPTDKRSDIRNLHCPAVCVDIRQAGRSAPTLAHFNHLQSHRWSYTQSPRFPHPSQFFNLIRSGSNRAHTCMHIHIVKSSESRSLTLEFSLLCCEGRNNTPAGSSCSLFSISMDMCFWLRPVFFPTPPLLPLSRLFTVPLRTLTPTGSCAPTKGCRPV